jgi:formylglycine-generating enzyme required for sulfatase activity
VARSSAKEMEWVTISEAGFTGQMSKYETTNAQYCQFLNAALASGDITVSNNRVYGANGSNSGADFVGQVYFDTYAADSDSQITYSGGIFSVRSRDGYNMDNHPVVLVSWYGATAYCNYYGYRLPTEWEWQAVADHYGEFTYGCGATIDHSKANYDHGNPLGLSSEPYTSPVNHYPSYGYGMNDMAGNVWEWTSTVYSSARAIRGGSWHTNVSYCRVVQQHNPYVGYLGNDIGFRVAREAEPGPGIIYVDEDATGTNDGSSWGNAFNHLQDGLAVAESGEQIWVAEGIYRPDEDTANPDGTGDRWATFGLINGVAIYGGFAGYETSLEERDLDTYETVLSGDLADNDGPDFANHGENSIHVVKSSFCDETAVLDGFTITAGNANGSNPNDNGGGMYNNSSSPIVTNCTFTGNVVSNHGGGVYNENSSPSFTNCTFNNNLAFRGAAMRNDSSNPTLTSCTFYNNSAIDDAGGIHNRQSSPALDNCIFSANSAGDRGGGMHNYNSSNPILVNCIFSGNSAENNGGGVDNYVSSSPTLTNCTFSLNSSTFGGGTCSTNSSSPMFTNCMFSGNSASDVGGGMYNNNSNPSVSNCTFTDNTAVDYGGGIYNDHGGIIITNSGFIGNSANQAGGLLNTSSNAKVTNCTFIGNSAIAGTAGAVCNPFSYCVLTNCLFAENSATADAGAVYNSHNTASLINCTFSSNSATNRGGGMFNNDTLCTMSNCIMWGDTATQGNEIYLYNDPHPSTINLAYSNVEGGEANIFMEPGCILNWDEGNIDADPLFADADGADDIVGTEDDNLRLLASSPCIDAGDNSAVPPEIATDLDGNSRFIDIPWIQDTGYGTPPIVDMGAYEHTGEGGLPDLQVTSEDITFGALPGIPGDPCSINATISNIGEAPAENISVIFRDFDIVIATENIPSLDPGESTTVSIEYVWPEASFRLITVEIDPENIIEESDDTNNSGSKVYQIGDVPEMDASIVISCGAPTGFPEGSVATIRAEAIYDILVEGQPNYEYPVKGGLVSVEVFDCYGVLQDVVEPVTNADGRFSASFDVPCDIGDQFNVVITVTDGTLTETLEKWFDVIAFKDLWVNPSDITFSDGNPDVDETVTISATVHASSNNTYTEHNIPVTFYVYPPTGNRYQIGQQVIAEMSPGGSFVVSTSWAAPECGGYYIQVALEPGFSDDRNVNNRAIRSLPVCPDPPPPPPPPTDPVYFDLDFSQGINFSNDNPDLGETVTIEAPIHAGSGNTQVGQDVPVTFYAHHAVGGSYKIGRTLIIEEINPGDSQLVSTTWRNAAEGEYVIEVILGPDFSDDNNGNNQVTREMPVGNRSPVAICKQQVTKDADGNCEATMLPEEVDDGSYDPDGDPITLTLIPSGPYSLGDTPVELIVTDDSGQSDSCPAIVTVIDATPPIITCPPEVTIECDQSTDPCNAGEATATDNCDPAPVITYSDFVSGSCPTIITRTWTATDATDNESSCPQTITIVDSTPPVFTTVPPNTTVECDGSGNQAELAAWLASAAAEDACGNVTITNDFVSLSDDCGATGSATVTWTATDECGNSIPTPPATFTIADTTPPSIDMPASDMTVECDGFGNTADLNAWLDSHGGAMATDTCGNVTWSHNFTGLSDDCGATGSAIVVFTATDECGGSSETTATFTIVDTTEPIFTVVPEDKTVQRDGNGNISELNEWLASPVAATDTCGSVSITNDFTIFLYECGKTGSLTVVWTAVDDCAKEVTTSATFTIEDPTTSVTYDGDLLLSTTGNPTINANLVASLRDNGGSVPDIDGEEVTFTLAAEGISTIVEIAYTENGIASVVLPLEPAIYTIGVTLGCSDHITSAYLVVYNPQGGFATGGGWLIPEDDGLNTHPDVRAHFGFEVEYDGGEDDPSGDLEFHYQDGYVELQSTMIERLVVTGGKIAQFRGWAVVNGVADCWFFVKAVDNGSPGRNNDIFDIKIWSLGVDPEGDPTERAGGVIGAGNIVVHAKDI